MSSILPGNPNLEGISSKAGSAETMAPEVGQDVDDGVAHWPQ